MARYHYWQYIMDEDGSPLEGVDIRFYLNDNPSVEADIFTDPEIGSPTTTSEAGVKTNGNGFFEFWVADTFESGGYTADQKFLLTWSRAGITEGSINSIDVFPYIFQVDETDNTSAEADDKNKLVSNALANKWSTHVDSVAGDEPHGFEAVNENSTDDTYNKLVSNSLLNYMFSVMDSAGTVSIGASGGVVRYFTIDNWTQYNSEYYYTDIEHFLGRQYPIVQCSYQSNNAVFEPRYVVGFSDNITRIWSTENVSIVVTIIG